MKFIISILLVGIFIIGCSSTNEPEVTNSITLSHQYISTSLGKTTNNIESIEITKAVFLIRDIKFKTQSEDETEDMFKTTPLILELDLSESIHKIEELEVPQNTYNRIEFDIHKAVAEDTLDMNDLMKEKFKVFLDSGKYSILLEGKIMENGSESDFIYKSDLNVKQKNNLDEPLEITDTTPNGEVLLQFSSANWFISNTGDFLDPRDSSNSNKIDKNIRDSIHSKKRIK